MKATLRVGGTVANRPPVAGADSAATDVGKGVTIAVLANDSDPDGDALTLTAVTNPPKGTSTVSTDKKSIVYLPDAGYKRQRQLQLHGERRARRHGAGRRWR